MWLEVGKKEDCTKDAMCKDQDVAGGREVRGMYDGRNVSGARMWSEVEATEDSMVDALYQEPGCGWR